MLTSLKGIISGGRTIDAIWGSFVRTKSKDGFYRIYQLRGNELHPLRAARTFKEKGKNGFTSVVREKFSTGSNNIQTSYLERQYAPNGTRTRTNYETENYFYQIIVRYATEI